MFAQVSAKGVHTESMEPVNDLISHKQLEERQSKDKIKKTK